MISDRIRKATLAALWLLAAAGTACSNRSLGDEATVLSAAVDHIRETQDASFGVIVPGLAAAVSLDGGPSAPVTAVASGASNPPGDAPLTPADRFHIGSITKTFTAALILQLDQEGRLSIADPIRNWIDFPNGDHITVEMLLGHTSGIPSFDDLPGHARDETPEQSIALAAQAPPLFPPGTSWSYSNTNYVMLGVIAQRITGSTFEAELRRRFFDPLELNDTYLWTGTAEPPTVGGSRLDCGGPDQPSCAGRRSVSIVPVTDGFNWSAAWASGSLVSTPSDVVRWMNALLLGNVLDPAHRMLLTTPTPQSVAALSPKPAYGRLRWTGDGLGLLRYEIEGQGIGWGHEGGIEGFVANVVRMNDSGQTVAMASNFEVVDAFGVLGDLVIATSSLDR